MRKLIVATMALLFVAAVAPAFGVSLFDGGTPVYAHRGDTNCAGGAATVFGLGGGPENASAGLALGQGTADFAKNGTLANDVASLHSIGCAAGLP